MSGEGTESGVSAGITDSPDSDVFVVLRNVFDEVVDGVVSVGAFIEVSGHRSGAVVLESGLELGANIDKIAFRHILSSNILIGEDVSGFGKFFGASETAFIVFEPVGASGVGGALEKDW